MCFHEAFFCVVKCRLSEIASSHCDNDVAYPLLGMQRVKQDGWGRRRHKRSRNFCRLLGRDAHKSFRKNSDSPLQGVCAVMRKLLHAIHGMLKKDESFDNTRFYAIPESTG